MTLDDLQDMKTVDMTEDELYKLLGIMKLPDAKVRDSFKLSPKKTLPRQDKGYTLQIQ